jgi:hypothetical protein
MDVLYVIITVVSKAVLSSCYHARKFYKLLLNLTAFQHLDIVRIKLQKRSYYVNI